MATSEVHVAFDEVIAHFGTLEDPRSTVNRRHPLAVVVALAILAILAGAEGPTGMARWANLNRDFLIGVLDLANGIPSRDVFRRVLMALRPEAFQACFFGWLQTLRIKAGAAQGIVQPILAVDGKTLRRSHDRAHALGALHSVSAWASEFGLSLGQVACAEKSNEITAIPELLRLVDINGAIITIDAMGTQKAIAAQIHESGGDYVLAVKGNQGNLEAAVVDAFIEETENDFASGTVAIHETTERAHGRTTTRTYHQMPVPDELPTKELWPGLATIGMVIATCLRGGVESVEIRYYISSLPLDVKNFARAVRGHWGIENTCHWVLDMLYREDESRARHDHLRQNLAWLRRFTLSLLKQHPGKISNAMKRRSCAWSNTFMMQVVTGNMT